MADQPPDEILNILAKHEDALDELVHDCFSQDASEVNNGGPEAQLEFLRSTRGWTWDDILNAMTREEE